MVAFHYFSEYCLNFSSCRYNTNYNVMCTKDWGPFDNIKWLMVSPWEFFYRVSFGRYLCTDSFERPTAC